MQRYLDLYGFRCMNELKLEELSLRERPHMVYDVIRNYLLIDNPARWTSKPSKLANRESGGMLNGVPAPPCASRPAFCSTTPSFTGY